MGDRTRQGTGQQVANPNSASGPFDMHGNKIIDLGNGTAPTDAVNLGQLNAGVAAAESYADTGDLNTLSSAQAYADAAVAAPIVPTVPLAYPYTTTEADREVDANATGGAISVLLKDGASPLDQIIRDVKSISATHNITVGLENAAKTLNGAINGTVVLSANGANRGFHRDSTGAWTGGV